MSIFSSSPTPCASDVVNNATLSSTLKIIKSSLNLPIERILDPAVLIKSELDKKSVSETINPGLETSILTVFWDDVVSKTVPAATAALIPSVKERVAPLVYEEFWFSINDITFLLEDSTSVVLKVPVN